MTLITLFLSLFFPLCGTEGATGFNPPGVIDFAHLQVQSHSEYLAGPQGFFKTPDQTIPVFNVAPDVLFAAVQATAQAQPRTFLLDSEPQALQAAYVVRSAAGNFPDVIECAVIPEPGGQSGLLFYSHSIYGEGDYGVNHKHLNAWLQTLNTKVSH